MNNLEHVNKILNCNFHSRLNNEPLSITKPIFSSKDLFKIYCGDCLCVDMLIDVDMNVKCLHLVDDIVQLNIYSELTHCEFKKENIKINLNIKNTLNLIEIIDGDLKQWFNQTTNKLRNLKEFI